VIRPEFLLLRYPYFWYYNILAALKIIAEGGWLADERCGAALDLLEGKRLPDGGFPAQIKKYRLSEELRTGTSLVDWGGVDSTRMNEFVTLDALAVLRQAGRL
jgi:hypothetical protein